MQLNELLRPDLIKVELGADKKRLAISELVDQLVQYNELPMKQRDGVLDELYANEESIGTGMEHGIAIPHVATDRVDDVLCAIGTSKAGVPFRSLDGKAARVVVLLLVPKREYVAQVKAMRAVEKVLGQTEFLDKVVAAKTGQEVFDLIKAAEQG
jgi:mannitol/fructose-specific phosphotransferase system IIA component (Ntr-type)